MAYTTIVEVNALLPEDSQVDSETYPTLATVEGWLPGLDSELNVAYVAGGGVVANMSADTVIWFGDLEAKEAAYRRMQVGGTVTDEESLWQQYHTDWTAAITKISDPETAVAVSASATVPPSSYTMNAPDNPDSTVNPVFKRSQAHNW